MASGELYAFGWIGSALLSAVIASSKNRNSCAWCAMGVAAGPLALLASVLMPARFLATDEAAGAAPGSSDENSPTTGATAERGEEADRD